MRQLGFLALTIAALLGCTSQPTAAQTASEVRTNLKAFIDSRTEAQLPAVEDALVPLGYQKLPEPPPPAPAYRTIFATTHETGPNQLGGWEKYERAVYNSGTASVSVADIANAKSGRYALKQVISGSSGARVFCLNDWSTGSRKPLPYTTSTTVWAYMPKRPTGSWMMVLGWKQTGLTTRQYNQPTIVTEFGNDMTYLRFNIKGRTSSPASPGSEPALYYVTQPTASRVAFPVAKWVKLTLDVKHSTGPDGYARLFQDGVKVLDYSGKTMRSGTYGNKVECELTCYGGNMGSNTTMLCDDFEMTEPQ